VPVIIFEGVDGAGKTTQVALLAHILRERGLPVVTTGVFKTAYGSDLRSWFMDTKRMAHASLRTQLFLLGSAMNQVAEEVIISSDSVVLVDRFVDTTMAYHGGGLELGIDAVKEVYAPILRRLTPDLVVVLDLPVDLIMTRKHPGDRIEAADPAFYERVRETYLAIASQTSNTVVVDATRTPTEVHYGILELVLARLDHLDLRSQG
jgi:dTMP kinase